MNRKRHFDRSKTRSQTYTQGEVKAYGLNCCLAIFRNRPQDIIKVYYNDDRKHDLAELLKWCSQNRLAYKLVSDEELEKITATRHHEGICCIVRERRIPNLQEIVAERRMGAPSCILLLEGVENPHNLGAILRTAAHFGADAVLVSGEAGADLSGAAMRVAEGGSEFVPVLGIGKGVTVLQDLKRMGYRLVGTSPHASRSLFATEMPERAVILMGSESRGLSRQLTRMVDLEVNIPGSGNVESLNVASAACVMLSEFFRANERRGRAPRRGRGGRTGNSGQKNTRDGPLPSRDSRRYIR